MVTVSEGVPGPFERDEEPDTDREACSTLAVTDADTSRVRLDEVLLD
jgi:hypothetical protein